MKPHYFSCICRYPAHLFTVSVDEEDFIISLQLNPIYPWYKRIWLAIKYVLGLSLPYGHWQETMLSAEEVNNLFGVCGHYLDNLIDKQSGHCGPIDGLN